MARRNTLKIDVLADVTKAEKEILRFSGHIKRFGKEVSDLGVGLTKISAPLAAIGGFAAKAALDIDEALDRIQAGTGATGTAMAGLEADFKAVASAVPQSFDETAGVLSDLNTRLGISGQLLQDVAISAMDASRLLGSNLTETVTQSARAIQNWGVPAAQVPKTLDKLFVASQQSGIGMDKLSAQMTQFGPILRTAGVDLDTTIALLSGFERQGVNTEAVMAGLKTSLGKLAASGVPTGNALSRLIGSIRSAQTPTEAMKRAVELFGKKAGPELAAAIREGRFGVDEMAKSLATASGAIQKTAQGTDGFSEQWARTMNQAKVALEPLGTSILRVAEKHLPKLQKALSDVRIEFVDNKVEMGLWIVGISSGTLAIGAMINTVASLIRNLRLLIATSKMALPLLMAYGLWNMDKSELAISSLGERQGLGLDKATQKKWDEYRRSVERQQDLLDSYAPRNTVEPEAFTPAKNKGKTGKSGDKSSGDDLDALLKGKPVLEQSLERMSDSMKYLHVEGKGFLGALDEWQAKLKPLSDDWKRVADLQTEIRTAAAKRVADETATAIKASETARVYDEQLRASKGIEDSISRAQDQAAAMGRYWDQEAFGNRLGLLPDPDYMKELEAQFAKLQGELSGKGIDASNWYNWTDEMKARFAELQAVAVRLATIRMDSLDEQLGNGTISTAKWKDEVAKLRAEYEKIPGVVTKVDERQKDAKNTSDQFGISAKLWANDLSKGLADAIVNAEDLGDALSAILKQLASSALQSLFGKIFGSIFGAADGAAFSGGRVLAYANGGIVSSPTIFPMASGMGLMGEAGPEAIMPLRRGADGRLGVEGAGGGTTVVNHFHIQAIDSRSFAEVCARNPQAIASVVAGNYQGNGMVRRVIKGS